jgi:rhamnose utilization protein RhaD (predicted bifunctional aldolase and dehydrogenase)/NAD(P)-dependent dehydrogenase (short-subunit alcohol dehydrogenase family)
MKSRWNDGEAAGYQGELAQRVYTSRLLGGDPSLVLHGGGNTSVKIRERNRFGEEEEILYVKGSGWDLATIEAAGFAPVRLRRVLDLLKLSALSDADMANELLTSMTDATAPAPSVEAILHALLPFRYVDHTHADALIAVTNTPGGREHVREIYGDTVVVVPYVMPGFKLAKACAEAFAAQPLAGVIGPRTAGMVLMNHGLVSFGETARASYERMIELVTRAEEYLARRQAWQLPLPAEGQGAPHPSRGEIAALRRAVSEAAGAPMIMVRHADAESLAFARRAELPRLAGQGPATPDHVIRTKRLPLLGRDVQGFRAAYERYFALHAARAGRQLTMLDAAPRVILDPDLGMCAIGRTARDAAIAAEVYHHTMEIILRATALEEYRALPAQDIFDVEYWDLEQAKLRRQGAPAMFAGEVALVTGAASGIGKACVAALRRRGAAVVGLDVNQEIAGMFTEAATLGLRCDVADEEDVGRALDAAVDAFGGLDMVVLNAGIFPASRRVGELTLEEWDRVMRVNLDANLLLLRETHPLLKLAPAGGRVAIIGSKNVPAPGPGAAAYSASKAALTQLARVAALEWGADGIRVNVLHPNAVFDTGIWSDEVLRARAAHYGMSVEQYKTNNVLRVAVTSHDVAELAAELCGPLFAKTTGAQIPIDGGNERVI